MNFRGVQLGFKVTAAQAQAVEARLFEALDGDETAFLIVCGGNMLEGGKFDHIVVTERHVVNISLKKPETKLIVWSLEDCDAIAQFKNFGVELSTWTGDVIDVGFLRFRNEDESAFQLAVDKAITSQQNYEKRLADLNSLPLVSRFGHDLPDLPAQLIPRRLAEGLDQGERIEFVAMFRSTSGIEADTLVLTSQRIILVKRDQVPIVIAASLVYSELSSWEYSRAGLVVEERGRGVKLGRLRHDKQDLKFVGSVLDDRLEAHAKAVLPPTSVEPAATTPGGSLESVRAGDSPVINVTTDGFESLILKASETIPVIIDVWATWCAPCKQLSPILEELAIEYAGRLLIAKVDADAEPTISQALQVQSIPSVFAVVKGQLIPLFQGAYPKDQVKQIFDKMLELAAEQGLSPSRVLETSGVQDNEAEEKAISDREVRHIGYKFPDQSGRLIARRLNPFLHDDEIVLFAGSFVPQSGISGDMIVLTQIRIMIFAYQQLGEVFSTVNTYSNIAKYIWSGSELIVTDKAGNTVRLGRLRHDKQDLNAIQTILVQHIASAPEKRKVAVTADDQAATTPSQQEPLENGEQVQSSEATFDIRLNSVPSNKISAIKSVRALAGLGLREAKNLVESAPVTLFRNVSQARASALKDELEKASAEISVIPNFIPAPTISAEPEPQPVVNKGPTLDKLKLGLDGLKMPDGGWVLKQGLPQGGLPENLPDPLPQGFALGDFGTVIDQPVGAEGAFGRIYRVNRAFDNKILAGKLYLRGTSGAYSDIADGEIRREVEALESLSHPTIMRVFGPIPVTTQGEWMILSEWIDGSNLVPFTDGSKPTPGADIFAIGSQLIEGIEYLEAVNVVHRDLKPANIMLTARGDLKIIDFNLARANGQVTTMAGTEMYMPPDFFHVSNSIDTFVDRYAVGVILFELVVKAHPYIEYFKKNKPLKATSEPISPTAVRFDVSAALSDFLVSATSPQESSRFSSAREMSQAWKAIESDIKHLSPTITTNSPRMGVNARVDEFQQKPGNVGGAKFCTECGSPQNVGNKFCDACGKAVK